MNRNRFIAIRQRCIDPEFDRPARRQGDPPCGRATRPPRWHSLVGEMTSELERQRTTRVREAYSAAARDPVGEHPFAVGRELALGVGYPGELLDRMPAAAVPSLA